MNTPLTDEINRLRSMLDAIARIPAVRDRAGVGDGSVHDAVVALSGALISAESELAALRRQIEGKSAAKQDAAADVLRNDPELQKALGVQPLIATWPDAVPNTQAEATPETDEFMCELSCPNIELPAQWYEYAKGLERQRNALQAKLDALMLEYCPNEMTQEQIANWQAHQRTATKEETDAANAALQEPRHDR